MLATAPLEKETLTAPLAACRLAQRAWSKTSIEARLGVIRRARQEMARASAKLVDAMPADLPRTRADSLVAEVLPLLAACRFLEREAKRILRPRRLGGGGRPVWLSGVDTVVQRVPLGVVLVIAPSNYPLFLGGVQALQALAAGNAVVWKPGADGRPVALRFAMALERAGLPENLLLVTGDSTADGREAIRSGVDKVIFTGSAETGRQVLEMAADTATPVVAELSGCDAVIVLPSADVARVLDAIAFGMRLNGSRTCMAPRRLFLVGGGHGELIARLRERFAGMAGVRLATRTKTLLIELIDEALRQGAMVHGDVDAWSMRPVLVENGAPAMRIAQADVFAPVLTVLEALDADAVAGMDKLCPFGLTAAIFGDVAEAKRLATRLEVGTVLINDLIVPTADPRVPFGGRRGSGFGSTRGAEGLLEMTAPRVVAVRRGRESRHFEPTGEAHEALFDGMIRLSHGDSFGERLAGLKAMLKAVPKLKARGAKDRETR